LAVGLQVGVKVWIVGKFEVKEWPEEEHGLWGRRMANGAFYDGDAYILLNTYKEGSALRWYH
jgi:hypothetical protein